MTKKILDISLSVFLISCAAVLIVLAINAKKIVSSYISVKKAQVETAVELKGTLNDLSSKYFSMIENQTEMQKDFIKTSRKINNVLFEAGIAFGARILEEERGISPTDSNKIINQSIDNIMKESGRLGMLAKALNDASRRNHR